MDIGVNKIVGCGIIGFERSGRLWMSKSFMSMSDDNCCLTIAKDACVSASAAEVTTDQIVLHLVWIGALGIGVQWSGVSVLKKK